MWAAALLARADAVPMREVARVEEDATCARVAAAKKRFAARRRVVT